jgi:hypothetical protein
VTPGGFDGLGGSEASAVVSFSFTGSSDAFTLTRRAFCVR